MPENAVISLRQDFFESRNEYRDAIDISWYKVIVSWGMVPYIMPNYKNSVKQYMKHINPKLIILSGGGDIELNKNGLIKTSPRNETEIELIHYSIKNNITLLGVCRGQQMINTFFKGKIKFVDIGGGHNNTIHEIVNDKSSFSSEKYNVNSYHNFIINNESLSGDLMPLWTCPFDNSIEAFRHKVHNIFGVSWHPERKGGDGLFLVKNMIDKRNK